MNDDRARGRLARLDGGGLIRATVLEVEPFGELEVKLDGRALERTAKRVANLDINLGTVERAVSGVELPFAGVVLVEREL